MKLFIGPRQSKQTESMIEHVTEELVRSQLYESYNKDNPAKILIVAPNPYMCCNILSKIVNKLISPNSFSITTPNRIGVYDMIDLINEPIVFHTKEPKDVTLKEMTEYDYVIVDDVFACRPYHERVLIRATVW